MVNESFINSSYFVERWHSEEGTLYRSAVIKFGKGESTFSDKLKEIVYEGKTGKMLDLRGVDLSGFAFKSVSLSHADLTLANLSNTKLNEVNLFGALLNKSNFENAELNKCLLSSAFGPEASFRNARLLNCDIDSTYLVKSNFHGAEIQGGTLSFGDLRGASFQDAIVENVDFYQTQITNDEHLLAILKSQGVNVDNLRIAELEAEN